MSTWLAPNREQETAFWNFVTARQEVWFNKTILKLPQEQVPYSAAYQILDRKTQFCVEEILENDKFTNWQRVMRLLVYRLCKSNAEFDNVIALINGILKLISDPACSLENLVNSLRIVPQIKEPISYQIALDMTLPLKLLNGNRLAPYADVNSWLYISPKIKHGLSIMGVCGNNTLLIRACKELYEKHVPEIHRRGFRWIRDSTGIAVPLSLADIGYCLDEFSRYSKAIQSGRNIKIPQLDNDVWQPQSETIPYFGKGDYSNASK